MKFAKRSTNKILSFILSLLGIGTIGAFTGCMYGSPAVEYGTPHATFQVVGQVSDVDQNKIEGIQVVMNYDTSYTDGSGNYSVQTSAWPEGHDFELKFSDLDGPENGDYQDLDTIASFVNPVFQGGSGSWDSGETEKELNIVLKKKGE